MEENQIQSSTEQQTGGTHQTVIVNQETRKSNGLGTAGFILALAALILSWAPVLNFIIWFLGLLFSFIGVFKQPRGLAIAGLVVSLIGIIIIVAVVGAALTFLS
ncbi:hypothetical protein EVD33_04595 [Bacteroidales bacterium SW292]|jgi:hypothetical protein|uniref:hypothetical protein n=1 Tax=Mediterranea sp. An20 TaxID=1965586 RepID=UPI000B3783DF|nr:hypothetical protein [Mediterranea sp. An20]MBW9202217.1 hypothetical protein [Bacteroidales bacterium SW292]OUP12249.1 hypothetical protein B5F34_01185 [Mediterranea sp. An20]